jgi:4-amino-4-deoxy-L-arabinose transferase-like glycosyltransferase
MQAIRTLLATVRRVEEDLRRRWLAQSAGAVRAPRFHLHLLVGIVVVAALVRFSTLGARSFWVDEAVVVHLVELGFWEMLGDLLGGTEGTPPLYYALAWFWAELFGTGEFGLRSLSAILGTAAVPVAYLAGRELLSSRVGLVAASLFALSPLLVWHSQDARAHSLAVLFAGLSFLFFLRALREPRRATIAWWAVFSVVGVFSHYFVVFLVAAEGAWLLLAFPSRRVVAAASGIAASLLALLPVALAQKSDSIDEGYAQYGALSKRLVEIPAQVLVGEQPPLQRTMSVLAAALVLPALWVVLRRATEAERRAALVPALLAGVGVAVPLAGAIVGFDYLIARNVLPFWLPALLVLAIGLGSLRAPRIVPATGLTLCLLWAAINVVTADVPKFEREEWRGAAKALGPAEVSRAIVVTPQPGRGPLRLYLSNGAAGGPIREITGDRERLSELDTDPVRIREIAVVALPWFYRSAGRKPVPPRPDSPPAVPRGFRQVEWREADYYTIMRFRAPAPAAVRPADLAKTRLSSVPPGILLQSGGTQRPRVQLSATKELAR